MKNIDKFRDIIEAFVENKQDIMVDSIGEPSACNHECLTCKLNCMTCKQKLIDWMFDEYEPPKVQLPEYIAIDHPILVSHDGEWWSTAHYARQEGNLVVAYKDGRTDWSATYLIDEDKYDYWEYARIPMKRRERRRD